MHYLRKSDLSIYVPSQLYSTWKFLKEKFFCGLIVLARFVKNKSGVYVLYDKKLNVLYIGQSDSLQKEFEKYVNTDFENDECKQKTHTYQRLFTENPKERMHQLLEDYKKEHVL